MSLYIIVSRKIENRQRQLEKTWDKDNCIQTVVSKTAYFRKMRNKVFI